jgi:hypothetical protein
MAELENVRIEYKNEYTINMGNFENQKPGFCVSATVKGVATRDELEEAKRKLKILVDTWLTEDVVEVKAGL